MCEVHALLQATYLTTAVRSFLRVKLARSPGFPVVASRDHTVCLAAEHAESPPLGIAKIAGKRSLFRCVFVTPPTAVVLNPTLTITLCSLSSRLDHAFRLRRDFNMPSKQAYGLEIYEVFVTASRSTHLSSSNTSLQLIEEATSLPSHPVGPLLLQWHVASPF